MAPARGTADWRYWWTARPTDPRSTPSIAVVPGLSFGQALSQAASVVEVEELDSLEDGLSRLARVPVATLGGVGFAAVVTDGISFAVLTTPAPTALAAARSADEPAALMDLDVSILHRVLIEQAWQLIDDEHHVGYAHDVDEALAAARSGDGIAILLRATPVDAVASVAAAGARMPRKSTFFTPKPASGLVMRRFADQVGTSA